MTTATPKFSQTTFGVTTADTCKDGVEMLKECGGDFRIRMSQVSYPVETTVPVGIDDSMTTTDWHSVDAWVPVRTDTNKAISNRTVGEGFTVFDNHDAVDLVNMICKNHELDFRFMAVTNGGAGLAMQVECTDLNDALNIGGDKHKGLLTIHTAHDGSASLRVTPTIYRMVCRNVLPSINRQNIANRKNGNAFIIRHSKNMETRLQSLVMSYRAAMGDLVDTSERLKLLTTKRCSAATQRELWKRVVEDGMDIKNMSKRAATQRKNKLDSIKLLAKKKENVPSETSVKNTFYHALQPLTAFGTHGITTRDRGSVSQGERRWASANTGAGANFSARALELACEMAGV